MDLKLNHIKSIFMFIHKKYAAVRSKQWRLAFMKHSLPLFVFRKMLKYRVFFQKLSKPCHFEKELMLFILYLIILVY